MTTRFVISADICLGSDDEGTTILDVKRGLLYSVIGLSHVLLRNLQKYPNGCTRQELEIAMGHDLETVNFDSDVAGLLELLTSRHVVDTLHPGIALPFSQSTVSHQVTHSLLTVILQYLIKLRLQTLAAVVMFVIFDFVMWLKGFHTLHWIVKEWIVRPTPYSDDVVQRISRSIERAAVYYTHNTLCLQRSAVLTCLLRIHGVKAEMVIGCRRIPFKGHAWVEVEGNVVNDNPRVKIVCSNILERC